MDDNYESRDSDVESRSNRPEKSHKHRHGKHKKSKKKKGRQPQEQAAPRSFSNLEIILAVSVCLMLVLAVLLLVLRITMFDYCALEYVEIQQISLFDELYHAPELQKPKPTTNKTSRRKRSSTYTSHSFGFDSFAGRPLVDKEYKSICGICFFKYCPYLESIAVMATPRWVIACDSSVKEIENKVGEDKNKIEILEWGSNNDWILYTINKTISHPTEDIRLIKSNTIFRTSYPDFTSLMSPIEYNSLTNRDMLVLVTVERNQNWTTNHFNAWAQPVFIKDDQLFVISKLPFTDNSLQIVTYGLKMYGLMSTANHSSLVILTPEADWIDSIIHY